MTPEERYEANEKLAYFGITKTFGSHETAASIAEKKYMHYEDIVQMARELLWKACINFEAERGFKFSTYAIAAIVRGIRRELENKGHIVKIPRDDRKPERVQLRYNGVPTSYFSEPIKGKEGLELGDFLPAADSFSSILADLHLEQLLSQLNAKERRIIILSLEGKKQPQIGKELGFSQAHVSRTFKKAMKKVNPDYEQYYKAN